MPSLQPAAALWRSVKRLEKAKINERGIALRNAVAVAVPLAVGMQLGNPLAAVAVALGALNVSYSDGRDPYRERARRMLLWSLLSGVAVYFGSVAGRFPLAGEAAASAWAFAAGMLLAVGTHAGDLGLNTLVTVIVFSARGSSTSQGAFYSLLLVVGGGLLQVFGALLFWPLRRNKPQLMAVGQAYKELAAEVNPAKDTPQLVLLQTPSVQVQDTLNALGRDHSIEGERLRLMFDQADRLRLSVYLVTRLRDALGEGDNQRTEPEGDAAAELDCYLHCTSILLNAVGDLLISGNDSHDFEALRESLRRILDDAQARKHQGGFKLAGEIAAALDVLAGQLRLVVQLAQNTTDKGEEEFLKVNRSVPSRLQAASWLETIKAHLTWSSPVFRHAVRLSICVAVAGIIERSISWQRAYWLPMTVAVVLKPDFTTTFTRGALRLAGTVSGLLLATTLYHLLPHSSWTQLTLVGIFTFFLRYWGPANYGVFTICISGLIVFLLAAAGVSPAEVVVARTLNTVAGGLLALLAYALWPTWERLTISESIADMLDAMRLYFRAVIDRFSANDDESKTLDAARDRWRLARSAAEAASDRLSSEPGAGRAKLDCINSILASSHLLARTIMGLEAGIVQRNPAVAPAAFRAFANDVEFTLYHLTAALRGSKFAYQTLPQLREDHRRMLESRNALSPLDEYVVLETDRITVTLNTLREQVARYATGC